MAGISFELRRILARKDFPSVVFSFFYPIVLAAGPWIISILAIVFAGLWAVKVTGDAKGVRVSQVVITYVMAISLIASSPFQLMFSRYTADRIFEEEKERILPNLMGALIFSMLLGLGLSLLFLGKWMIRLPVPLTVLFLVVTTFTSAFWVVNTMLTSLKNYKNILFAFLLGFSIVLILVPFFQKKSQFGFLYAYFLGFFVLFLILLIEVFREFPSTRLLEFDFLKPNRVFYSLAFTGFFYNLAIWIDKFIFWCSKTTGTSLIGPFRASFVYDSPMFLAYLVIAPGMGFFLLKLEGEFAIYYQRYYEAVRTGETLIRIFEIGYDLIISVRTFVQEVLRIQLLSVIFILLIEENLFNIFGISLVYISLFNILTIATSLQLLFMVVLSLFFYFDLRKETLLSTAIFLVSNGIFTLITLKLGPYYYGSGFLFSLLLSFVVSIILLRRYLYDIHYKTFMFAL